MANITVNTARRSTTGSILRAAARRMNLALARFAQRRTLRELSVLDDHQLADIGLRREQLTTSLFASERYTGL